jgi:predicted lipoprotein with Yx(FWY)xxD motif
MKRGLLVVGALVVAALLPGTASATVVYPPRLSGAVRTGEGFELKGVVYDYGGTTTYHFEYGTTTEYGTSVPMPDAEAGTGYASSVSQMVTGLAADTVYHYRLVSNNSVEGVGMSEDGTFSTALTPTTPSPSGGGAAPTTPGQPYPGTGEGSAPAVGGSGPKTLYTLSAERHGKFICTEASGCTGIWHPLTVASGVVPKGPVKLGTIKRPEGTVQVTYRGLPLYTFASDKKRGQVKGEGLKDVGTWHAAFLPSKTAAGGGSTGGGSTGPGAY